jgi:tyrosyl-tRNA synthetase
MEKNNICDIDTIINNLTQNIFYIKGNLKNLLTKKKTINILWGIQPREIPTIELFIPILKMVEFLKLNKNTDKSTDFEFKLTVLIADIHQMLETPEIPLDVINHRGEAILQIIMNLIESFDINPFDVKYIFGSKFQLHSNYVLDIYKISALSTIKKVFQSRELKLDSDDNKNSIASDATMSTLLYPILQSLDEKFTECDIFYGSITQKNMCIFSEEIMKKFNEKSHTIYLLQDFTKKININFTDNIIKIEEKLNKFNLDDIFYILENIIFKIMTHKNDIMIIFDKDADNNRIEINNIEELKLLLDKKIINNNNLIELTSNYLYKYLYEIKDIINNSQMKYFIDCGWNNKKFF